MKSLKEKNGPFFKKSLGSPMPLVQSFFKWLKASMPLVQRPFYFIWKFFSFLGKIWKVHQMLHGFLEFKETKKHGINKQTLSLTMMLQPNVE